MKKFFKILGIAAIVIASLFIIRIVISVISYELMSENKKAVSQTLKYLNGGDGYRQFDFLYWGQVRDLEYYPMNNWTLIEVPKTPRDTIETILAMGSTKNNLGMTVPIEQYFYLNEGKIVDTKGVFHVWLEGDQTDGKKISLLGEVYREVKIVNYNATQYDYQNYIKGEARVRNDSSIPVSNIILRIKYFDKKGEVTQTDETYIRDQILPGQSKQVSWMTSPCSNCKDYRVSLDFSEIR
ncbi:MAG: FxLYD domain-containing protein [Desulfomicrobium sp.]|nr:FxLYD domain-containing protein [Desulfomicrobium sp.]